jgi:hypothetical protein
MCAFWLSGCVAAAFRCFCFLGGSCGHLCFLVDRVCCSRLQVFLFFWGGHVVICAFWLTGCVAAAFRTPAVLSVGRSCPHCVRYNINSNIRDLRLKTSYAVVCFAVCRTMAALCVGRSCPQTNQVASMCVENQTVTPFAVVCFAVCRTTAALCAGRSCPQTITPMRLARSGRLRSQRTGRGQPMHSATTSLPTSDLWHLPLPVLVPARFLSCSLSLFAGEAEDRTQRAGRAQPMNSATSLPTVRLTLATSLPTGRPTLPSPEGLITGLALQKC